MKSESLLYIFGYENPYFTQVIPKSHKPPSPSSFFFKLAANIDPNDPRSLLGNELPGFSVFDTTIAVAGEGTNFSNLPVESSPPDNILRGDQAGTNVNPNDNKNTVSNIPKPTRTTHGKKVVFFYNTHSLESFLPALNEGTDPNKAWSSKVNVGTVAEHIGEDLQKRGIGFGISKENVTKKLEQEGLQYYQSYQVSRPILENALKDKNYQLFFDIHRDSSGRKSTTVTINNKSYARVMFVIGKANKNYQKNLAEATALHHILEKKYPGLSKGVILKDKSEGDGVYNQDLSPHAILIEVGGYDNTMTELNRTANALSDAITQYYWSIQ